MRIFLELSSWAPVAGKQLFGLFLPNVHGKYYRSGSWADFLLLFTAKNPFVAGKRERAPLQIAGDLVGYSHCPLFLPYFPHFLMKPFYFMVKVLCILCAKHNGYDSRYFPLEMMSFAAGSRPVYSVNTPISPGWIIIKTVWDRMPLLYVHTYYYYYSLVFVSTNI